jgi:RNA polymerase-binding protein DksA
MMPRKLAKSTLERFRKRLEDERDRLTRLVEEYQRELEEARLTESSSDRSPDPGDPESSSVKLEYAKELSIERNTLDLLSTVDRALARIESGEYGLCENCGKAIPVERLDVLPYTTLCVDCAAQVS